MKNYVDAKALQEYTTKLVAKLKTLFPGTPTAAATVAEMTDHSKTYVYVGTESGYTAGDWYYWNGTAWTSGGPFQATSIITDTTLAVAGEAADAKATGDAIAAAKTAVLNAMAPAYSTSGTYAVGNYVNHNGAIYRCTTAITTAEAWTAGHWTEVPLGTDLADQVGALKESIFTENDINFGVSDWRTGYYKVADGTFNQSPYYICTGNDFTIVGSDENSGNILKAKAPENYYVSIYEYDSNNTCIGTYGDAQQTNETSVVITDGHYYRFTIGRFSNKDADDYLTSDFINQISVSISSNAVEDAVNKVNSLYSKKTITFNVSDWRTGYYKIADGLYTSSNNYMCTESTYIICEEFGMRLNAKAPTERYIAIHEYDKNGKYIQSYGSATTTADVTIDMVIGHRYRFSIGRFAGGTAPNYLTQDFISQIKVTIDSVNLTNGLAKKQKTGDYEFFSVTVDKPLSFGGEEIANSTEEIECVLRLPDSYNNIGGKTRLILACHGASGYIDVNNNVWYNSNWKAFMDALLSAGYAVFDANILPTSTGTEQMGYALGSPLYINVLKKAYDYIIANYNVYDKIFAHGTSMGGVGATAFSHAYPELVLAESSFAGRDFLRYLLPLEDGTASEERFAISYGYASLSDLNADKFSHCEGCFPSLSLVKYVNGVAQFPPDRESDYQNWLTYFSTPANLTRNADAGVWTGKRTVPYKAWNSWADNEQYTKLETILQKAYNNGESCPYYLVNYETGTHTQMSYGLINDMIPQLISWFKRWE